MTIGLYGVIIALEYEAVASFHVIAENIADAIEKAEECLEKKQEDDDLDENCRVVVVSQDLDVRDIANYDVTDKVNSANSIKFEHFCGEIISVDDTEEWKISCPNCGKSVEKSDLKFVFGKWEMASTALFKEKDNDIVGLLETNTKGNKSSKRKESARSV